MNESHTITYQTIWDLSRLDKNETLPRMELTDLIRFKGMWYCSFHEGVIHMDHPAGRCRIIRSADGEHWETAALFDWQGADVHEIYLSITAEGWLMGNTSVSFVPSEPIFINQDKTKAYHPGTPSTDEEAQVNRQSVSWLTQDGIHWSNAYACNSGVNTWRWATTWHNGMGYSMSYCGARQGDLFRTRDGKQWRLLAKDVFPQGQGNEGVLIFDKDETLYCLLRDAIQRRNSNHHGKFLPMLGVSTAPNYNLWEWKELSIDLKEEGGLLPAEEALHCPLGGPKLIRLSDGRILAAARVHFPNDNSDHNHICLFFLDTETATLTKFADINGTTYAGIVEYEGQLWVSCGTPTASEIILAKVDL